MTNARETLLAFAAELDARARSVDGLSDPAYSAYDNAAELARERAAALPADTNTTSPVSQDPGSGSGAQGAARRPVIPRLEAAPPGDWRDDLCTCDGRPQHIHCPWGGGHVHYVDDEGNDIHQPRLPERAPDAP